MTRLLTQGLSIALSLAAIVWLADLGWRLWQTPIRLDAGPPGTASPRERPAIPELDRLDLTQFSQSLARPLFFEARRMPTPQSKPAAIEPPRPAPPPAPPKPVALPDKVRLLGVSLQTDQRLALIEAPPQPAHWLQIGGRIGDWTIAEIEENQIVLHHSARSATLQLYSETPAK